jgi:Zn-dependent protease with chaperone function
MLSSSLSHRFSLPSTLNPQVRAERSDPPTPVGDLTPLAPDGVEKLMRQPDLEESYTAIQRKARESGEDMDIVQHRRKPLSERLIGGLRGPCLSALKDGASLLGASLFGPVGLSLGVLAQAGFSLHSSRTQPTPSRLKSTLVTTALSAAVGALGLIPGSIGTIAGAATLGGLAWLAERHSQDAVSQYTLRMTDFAREYIPRVEARVGKQADIQPPNFSGMDSRRAEKLAAQAINSATRVACEQLSPSLAVALARETARALVPQGGAVEDAVELLMTLNPSTHLDANIQLGQVPNDSPAMATVRSVILKPDFVRESSPETVAFTVGHEQSHIDHRDSVANLGDLTLQNALEISSNQTLNPSIWKVNNATLNRLKLASAEKSREVELRCDQEGVNKMLESGATWEQVSKGISELFSKELGGEGPMATHPPSWQRSFFALVHLANKRSQGE